MKFILSMAFATGALLTGLALAQAPPPVDQLNQQKARALIDQAIQALGGSAYLNIQDVTQDGRSYSFHLGTSNGAGVQFWRFYRYPDQDRVEVTKKRDVIYVYNGDKGYEITYKGTHPGDPKEVADYMRRRAYALDFVLRKWLNEPGIALFYEGPAVAEQKSAEQVTIMNTRNQALTLYLDVTTHLPLKKSFTWRDPSDKLRNEESEVYDNYRPIQGVMTPFSVTRYYNGDMSNQRFLHEITYNQGLSDSLFNVAPNQPAPKK